MADQRPPLAMLLAGCLVLGATGCSLPMAPVDEKTFCEAAIIPLYDVGLDDRAALHHSLEVCDSRDEWRREAAVYLSEPYRGDRAKVRQLLEDLCDDGEFSMTEACMH